MHIKTSGIASTFIGMVERKKKKRTSVGRTRRNRHSCVLWKAQQPQRTAGTSSASHTEGYRPQPGTCTPQEWRTGVHTKSRTQTLRSSTSHNSQELGTTQMSISWRMDQRHAVYPREEGLFNRKQNGLQPHAPTRPPWKCHTKSEKADTEAHMLRPFHHPGQANPQRRTKGQQLPGSRETGDRRVTG